MIGKTIITVIIIYSAGAAYAAGPIQLGKTELNGIYIGEHIKYLSEKELFPVISRQWKADKAFRDKIISGRLSSDDNFIAEILDVPGGYRAHLKRRADNSERDIEWGIADIQNRKILSRFKQSGNEIPRFNFIPHSYWLQFSINNTLSSEKGLYLELDKYFFNMVHLFYYENDRLVDKRAYITDALNDREVKDKNMILLIKALPGINTYFLRIDSWFMDVVPLRLWTRDPYYRHIASDNALLGIIAGIFILIFIYSLFIFITMKDKSYLYLALLTLSTLFINLVIDGFGFQFLWPDSPLTGIYLLYEVYPLSMIFMVLFSRNFVGTYQYTPGIDRLMLIITAVLVLFIPLIYLAPFSLQQSLFVSLFLFDHVYYYPLFISSVAAVRHKNRYGYFLLTGLVFYNISQVEWLMTNLDIIPYRFVNYLNIKGVAFTIIIVMGLGYKFKVMSGLINRYRSRLDAVTGKLKDKPITDKTKLKIEQVKEFLRENFREDISREGLASAIDMSPDHLGRIFKKDTGEKISDFINRLRIEEAEKQLKDTNSKIIDIAFSVGFESLRTFNKVFQKAQGVSPSEYRKAPGQ